MVLCLSRLVCCLRSRFRNYVLQKTRRTVPLDAQALLLFYFSCTHANVRSVLSGLCLLLFKTYIDFFQGNGFIVVFPVLIPVLNKTWKNRVTLSHHDHVAGYLASI